MLNVQSYLRGGKSLGDLSAEFGIRVCRHPALPLCIVNYDQAKSPRNPITDECRALVLEFDTWRVVARSFDRFYWLNEYPERDAGRLAWSDVVVEDKLDGSLMQLFPYCGEYVVTTRGSFAEGRPGGPGGDCGPTWSELFWRCLDRSRLLPPEKEDRCYTFELVSPYNRVICHYSEPALYLIGGRSGLCEFEFELGGYSLDFAAQEMGIRRPTCYELDGVYGAEPVVDWVNTRNALEAEGCVLRCGNYRVKVKSRQYLVLHRLLDNGNLCRTDRLLPILLANEQSEVLTAFPHLHGPYFDLAEKLRGQAGRMMAVWECAKELPQKEFANFVLKHTKLAPILFEARKRAERPEDVLLRSERVLLKVL